MRKEQNVGSSLETKVHRQVVEDRPAMQSRQVDTTGNTTTQWRNGTWRIEENKMGLREKIIDALKMAGVVSVDIDSNLIIEFGDENDQFVKLSASEIEMLLTK
jgi:hypothetical protein